MTTPRDPLAAVLRAALEEERPVPGDDALVARAIARAARSLAAAPASTDATLPAEPRPSSASPPETRREAAPPTRDSTPARAVLARSRGRAIRFAIPIAAAFVASIAVAAVLLSRAPEPVGSLHPSEVADAPLGAPSTARAAIERRPPAGETTVSVEDLPSASHLTAAAPGPARPPTSSPPSTLATAAELFRTANAERRANNIDAALELYRSLLQQHPESSESQAARVSVGRLLLDRKQDPAGALAQFDAYLSSATENTTLAEEARLGRALALKQLGKTKEERQAWEELMLRHPATLHSSRARERLAALADRSQVPSP